MFFSTKHVFPVFSKKYKKLRRWYKSFLTLSIAVGIVRKNKLFVFNGLSFQVPPHPPRPGLPTPNVGQQEDSPDARGMNSWREINVPNVKEMYKN